jgi:hypothetical protein
MCCFSRSSSTRRIFLFLMSLLIKILMLKLQLLTCRLWWTILGSAAIWIFSSLKLFLPTPPLLLARYIIRWKEFICEII